MNLGNYSTVRTGLVLSRKEAQQDNGHYIYRALSLRNVTEDGQILLAEIEDYSAIEPLKGEYFTHNSDVLIRLSTPYTAILISEKEANLLVPSHFAIIRVNEMVDPHYLHWWLGKNKKWLYKNASGGTIMGTISSGYISEMIFKPPPMEKQRRIRELLELSNREQHLFSLLGTKKKHLINAILKKLNNE